MRWFFCKNQVENNRTICDTQMKNLLQKQCEIRKKEQELIDKELELEKLLKGIRKCNSLGALRDMEASVKFKQARKIIKTAETKEKLEKCEKKRKRDKKHKKSKKKASKQNLDILHKFFDNYFKMDGKIRKIRAIKSVDFLTSVTRRILQPQPIDRSNYRRQSGAGDCYLMSLRKTPHVGIYHRWPQLYPPYLDLRSQCKNCKFMCMFLLGFLFWIPCFIFLEVCKCFLCCCCHDC